MSFGEKIKALRKEKGWSLDKLAEKAELHSRLIGKYESGSVVPTAISVVKIANALNVSIDYLLIDQNNDSTPIKNIKDVKLIELFEELEKMQDKDKETIITLIDAFIEKNKKKK